MDAVARRHAREYETIYILRPDVSPDDADKAQARMSEVIQRLGGKLLQIDQWGRRKLAYKVSRQKKGIYVVLRYAGYGDLVAELERNLRMTDPVIKHQTVLLNDDLDPETLTVDPTKVEWKRIEITDDPDLDEMPETPVGMETKEAAAVEGAATGVEGAATGEEEGTTPEVAEPEEEEA